MMCLRASGCQTRSPEPSQITHGARLRLARSNHQHKLVLPYQWFPKKYRAVFIYGKSLEIQWIIMIKTTDSSFTILSKRARPPVSRHCTLHEQNNTDQLSESVPSFPLSRKLFVSTGFFNPLNSLAWSAWHRMYRHEDFDYSTVTWRITAPKPRGLAAWTFQMAVVRYRVSSWTI